MIEEISSVYHNIIVFYFRNWKISVLQKLLRYFNGTIISTFFVPPFLVFPVIFCLNLNELLLLSSSGKTITLPLASIAGSSL